MARLRAPPAPRQQGEAIGGLILTLHYLLGKRDFTKAELHGVKLIRANLHGVNFFKAHLGKADLSRADLREANLTEASLYQARPVGAGLC